MDKTYYTPEETQMAQEPVAAYGTQTKFAYDTIEPSHIDMLPPYTMEELNSRIDTAMVEIENGNVKDGETFFAELIQHITAR